MATITIGKYRIEGTNHQELIGLKKEIFHESRYFVDLDNPIPRIIDAGAHVGLATIYFKNLWPKANITCIEPHPELCRLLRQNIWFNRLDGVNILEAALAEQVGERPLYFDCTPDHWFSTASFEENAWNHEQTSMSVRVPTIPLKSIVTSSVDLLKLDIEGAESTVLTAAGQILPHIHHIIVEYHPHRRNSWHKFVSTLNKYNFFCEHLPAKEPPYLRTYHFINEKFSSNS